MADITSENEQSKTEQSQAEVQAEVPAENGAQPQQAESQNAHINVSERTDKNGSHRPGPSTSSGTGQQTTGKKRKHQDDSIIPGYKYFMLRAGNTLNSDKDFMDRLEKRISGLQEVKEVEECDFILAFCPIVSRAGTDIEAALHKLNNKSATKPTVFVALHHTFDPDQAVPDSSRCVGRENTMTVDCLFHEDQGLLQCSRNNEALSRITNHLKSQVPIPNKISSRAPVTDEASASNSGDLIAGNKYFIVLTGNTLNTHMAFTERLRNKIPVLQEVPSEQACDFILAFCPIVSRAGTDIEAGLQKLNAKSDTKPAVFVALHHTFDPHHTVPDSSRCVNREKTITVDCLFHEDQGLLLCSKNDESLATVVKHINKSLPRTQAAEDQTQFDLFDSSSSEAYEKSHEGILAEKDQTQLDQFDSSSSEASESSHEGISADQQTQLEPEGNVFKATSSTPGPRVANASEGISDPADSAQGDSGSVRTENRKTHGHLTNDNGVLQVIMNALLSSRLVKKIQELFAEGENPRTEKPKDEVESVTSENKEDQSNPDGESTAVQPSDSTHDTAADRTEERDGEERTEVFWEKMKEKHYGSNFNDFAIW